MYRDTLAVIDGSLEGLLNVVFARYYHKLNPSGILIRDMFQQRLDSEYVFIDSDPVKAGRVLEALEKKSPEAAENMFYAFANPDDSRFMDIFNYIVLVFAKGREAERHLTTDYVRNVIAMSRRSGMEAHKLNGFVRFLETRSGVLYSEIGPTNDVLIFVAGHFAQRLISEAWIIHDIKRKKAAVYNAKEFVLTDTDGLAQVDVRPGEERFQELWVQFLQSVAIKERVNLKLQRQLLPNKYRSYMTEFKAYSSLTAPTGHTPAQAPQEIHSGPLTT